MFKNFWIKLIIIAAFLFLPHWALADYLGERVVFNIDPSYDSSNKSETTATLQKITDQLYFYLDDEWWNSLTSEQKQKTINSLSDLAGEFEQKIYPILTLNFGTEWKPGIDNDNRITVLFYPMIEDAGGYFNSGDEYQKIQVPTSNLREMVYLNTKYLPNEKMIKSFMAHELTHLISFNQKERIQGEREETWLEEGRAEMAISLLGYNLDYQGSNLESRVANFLQNPRDSLTEWKNQASDYGVLNLFFQYMTDHYGMAILDDSMKSKKTGIPSLNEALAKNGFNDDFSQVFTDWTVAVYVNDCTFGSKYCYLNDNLKNFRITPYIYFLPLTGDSTLSTGNLSKEWAGNWQKIIGGNESLTLEFTGTPGLNFKVPYVVQDQSGNQSINFLKLDQSQKGEIVISDGKIASLSILPSIQTKTSDFSDKEPEYQFFWSVSSKTSQEDEIQALLDQIDALKEQISKLQAQIAALSGGSTSCLSFQNNLYYGLTDNAEVRCLQQFLKDQGTDIYPEGWVTGNFLSMTQKAVIRFQEKYSQDVLVPLGLAQGTGFVGQYTRDKINEILNG
jgi:polyhydroxyalkanoate synthesis regulator phasin